MRPTLLRLLRVNLIGAAPLSAQFVAAQTSMNAMCKRVGLQTAHLFSTTPPNLLDYKAAKGWQFSSLPWKRRSAAEQCEIRKMTTLSQGHVIGEFITLHRN